jgi:hypothetical protein
VEVRDLNSKRSPFKNQLAEPYCRLLGFFRPMFPNSRSVNPSNNVLLSPIELRSLPPTVIFIANTHLGGRTGHSSHQIGSIHKAQVHFTVTMSNISSSSNPITDSIASITANIINLFVSYYLASNFATTKTISSRITFGPWYLWG